MQESRRTRLLPYLLPVTAFTGLAALVWPDVGPNLFSDALALWFGLFVIDSLLEQERNARERPARLAAWRSIWRIHSQIILFIDRCVESHWTNDSAQSVWRAYLDQRAHPLCEMLSTLRIDVSDDDLSSRIWSGRSAVSSYFEKAVRESDRFCSRYVGVAEPSAVEIIERFETLMITEGLTSWGPNISHIGPPVWEQLFDVEVELRKSLLNAYAEYGDDFLSTPQILLEKTERWLHPSDGWSDCARAQVARPDR